MKYLFVLVNYANSWSLILSCLDSVARDAQRSGATYGAVVVDNDPPGEAGTPEIKGAEVVRIGRNVGFARAVNRGIRGAEADVIVLVNPDTVLKPGFFDGITACFREDPSVGIVGPRIEDADGRVQLSARRDLSLVSGLFGRTSILTRLFPESRLAKGQFVTESGTASRVDWVSGACMAVRREVLEKVGLLDERFFMYFEDADLCRRAREAGFAVRYLPTVSVVHDAGGSTKSRPLALLRLHRSAFLYHRKHGKHGPFGLFSLFVLAGLAARASAGVVLGLLRSRSGRA